MILTWHQCPWHRRDITHKFFMSSFEVNIPLILGSFQVNILSITIISSVLILFYKDRDMTVYRTLMLVIGLEVNHTSVSEVLG